MSDEQLQRESRARIRAEQKGDPSWVDLGNGWFALHIQYGGGAVTVHFDGSGDADAFREWLAFHWPAPPPEGEPSRDCSHWSDEAVTVDGHRRCGACGVALGGGPVTRLPRRPHA